MGQGWSWSGFFDYLFNPFILGGVVTTIWLTLAAIAWQSLPAYLVALVIAGTGFGTCFYGVLRSIVPVVRPDERGELFAALFTLSYLAFGIPTLLAGMAVGIFGLTSTTLGYGALIVLFSATAGLLRKFGTRD